MFSREGSSTGHVIRPAVVLAMVYIALCSLWFLWILLTARALPEGSPEVNRMLSTPKYGLLSLGNVLVAALVIGDGLRARLSSAGLSNQHAAGMLLAVITIAFVQLAGFYANQPVASAH